MKVIKNLVVVAIGLLSAFYLANPFAGVIEFLPDNVPVFGNLDEFAAAVILLRCLKYFGIDLFGVFGVKDTNRVKVDPDLPAIGGGPPDTSK